MKCTNLVLIPDVCKNKNSVIPKDGISRPLLPKWNTSSKGLWSRIVSISSD